jgi:hypothetical protein
MELRHHVPASRLTRQYFRRWWFWKGVSRARVDAMHRQTELGLDLRGVPYVAHVPRFIWGLLVRALWRWARAVVIGDRLDATRFEMQSAYAVGYARACLMRDARQGRLHPISPRQASSLSR